MSEAEGTNWVSSNFEALEQLINGEAKSSLHQVRKDALASFNQVGFPSSKSEDWKYTDMRKLASLPLTIADEPKQAEVAEAELAAWEIEGLTDVNLVFVNGYFSEQLSNLGELPKGVTVRRVAEVLSESGADQEVIESHLAKNDEQAFVALNTAFVKDGVFVKVDKNVVVDTPIRALFLTTSDQADIVINPRIVIVAEEGSQCTVLEQYVGAGAKRYFTTAVTDVSVAANANVWHYRVQEEGNAAYHVSVLRVHQEKDSNFYAGTFQFGGAVVRNDVSPVLDGEGIFSELLGLNVLDAEQHVDNHTVIDHAKPHGESNELYKGVYNGKSKGVFNGTIIVRPDAQKTNAIQSNQSILLSEEATSNAKPQLKIWADDVRCTHGATVGQLDDDGLFYIRSRGVGEEEARNMLIHAFASEVISEVNNEPLRLYLEKRLMEKL